MGKICLPQKYHLWACKNKNWLIIGSYQLNSTSKSHSYIILIFRSKRGNFTPITYDSEAPAKKEKKAQEPRKLYSPPTGRWSDNAGTYKDGKPPFLYWDYQFWTNIWPNLISILEVLLLCWLLVRPKKEFFCFRSADLPYNTPDPNFCPYLSDVFPILSFSEE